MKVEKQDLDLEVRCRSGNTFVGLKGIVSPPERCDFMSLQQCNNNVL